MAKVESKVKSVKAETVLCMLTEMKWDQIADCDRCARTSRWSVRVEGDGDMVEASRVEVSVRGRRRIEGRRSSPSW